MATEAETSSARLAYTRETTYGVNPATGAKFLRITSESLKQAQTRVTSEEVNGTRLPRQSIRTGVSAQGGTEFEFSINNFDDLLSAMMMIALPAVPASITTGSIAVDGTLGKFTSVSGTPGFVGILKGQWFRTSGFTNAGNNNIFQATADGTLTDLLVGTGAGLVTETTAAGRTIKASQLMRPGNSVTGNSFTLERQWTDINNVFEMFNGMVIETLSLKMAVEQKITGTISWMGQNAAAVTTTTSIGSTASAGTELIAAAVDALRGVREGTLVSDSALHTTELGFNFSNKTRIKKDAASLAAFGVGLGIIEVGINWTVYLHDKSIIDKYRNNTLTPMSFRIEGPTSADADYVFTFPAVRITDVDDAIGGNSQDGMLKLTMAAETDANGVAVQIDKVPA